MRNYLKKIIIIASVLFSVTILVVLAADSILFRNLVGASLPEDDLLAVKKIISNTQSLNWEADTKGSVDYFFENNEFKANFDGRSFNLRKETESDLNFKTTVNKLSLELPSSFTLKLRGGEKDFLFSFSLYDSWFKFKNLVFNISPDAVLSAKKVGFENLDSQNYAKYEFNFNPKIVFGGESEAWIKVAALVDLKRAIFKKVDTDILVSGADGRFRFKKEDIYNSYDFKGAIVAPESAMDVDFSHDEINLLLRDIKRKNDLKRIGAALEKYKEDNGKYPILTTDSRDYNFLEPLKNSYLTDIPKDPSLVYYYKYKSADGEGFSLTAILENKEDPEGQKQGDILVYKLSNK